MPLWRWHWCLPSLPIALDLLSSGNHHIALLNSNRSTVNFTGQRRATNLVLLLWTGRSLIWTGRSPKEFCTLHCSWSTVLAIRTLIPNATAVQRKRHWLISSSNAPLCSFLSTRYTSISCLWTKVLCLSTSAPQVYTQDYDVDAAHHEASHLARPERICFWGTPPALDDYIQGAIVCINFVLALWAWQCHRTLNISFLVKTHLLMAPLEFCVREAGLLFLLILTPFVIFGSQPLS